MLLSTLPSSHEISDTTTQDSSRIKTPGSIMFERNSHIGREFDRSRDNPEHSQTRIA
jgi:hypothetical protein